MECIIIAWEGDLLKEVFKLIDILPEIDLTAPTVMTSLQLCLCLLKSHHFDKINNNVHVSAICFYLQSP